MLVVRQLQNAEIVTFLDHFGSFWITPFLSDTNH
jgi:hypothetical protein